jgi:hypothetical protein
MLRPFKLRLKKNKNEKKFYYKILRGNKNLEAVKRCLVSQRLLPFAVAAIAIACCQLSSPSSSSLYIKDKK